MVCLHVQSLTIPGTNAVVQIVVIDTVTLAGLTHPLLRDMPPSGPTSVKVAEDSWQWIEDTLSASTAQWLIVCGHYPGKWYWLTIRPMYQLTMCVPVNHVCTIVLLHVYIVQYFHWRLNYLEVRIISPITRTMYGFYGNSFCCRIVFSKDTVGYFY